MVSISELASLIGTVAVLGGVILALFQLRQFNKVRMMDVTIRLYSQFGQTDFQRHYWRVHQSAFSNYEDFKLRASPEDWQAMFAVAVFFENMGLLLKRKLASIDLLDDLLSGPILLSWEKLRPVIEGYRLDSKKPQIAEWFELLYRRMDERLKVLAAQGKPIAGA